jgi:hypothetical protein
VLGERATYARADQHLIQEFELSCGRVARVFGEEAAQDGRLSEELAVLEEFEEFGGLVAEGRRIHYKLSKFREDSVYGGRLWRISNNEYERDLII